MSLENLLAVTSRKEVKKEGITEERMRECLPGLRARIAFYRAYPDIFIDDIKGPECVFKFYTYQRVFLRVCMRYKWTYAVYPRA